MERPACGHDLWPVCSLVHNSRAGTDRSGWEVVGPASRRGPKQPIDQRQQRGNLGLECGREVFCCAIPHPPDGGRAGLGSGDAIRATHVCGVVNPPQTIASISSANRYSGLDTVPGIVPPWLLRGVTDRAELSSAQKSDTLHPHQPVDQVAIAFED